MAENEKGHGEKGGEDHGKGHGGGGHGGGGHGHGGGGHEEHAGAPEWLISFADNVALLMGFFVILLAMNMKEQKANQGIGGKDGNPAMQDFVIAMRAAFHTPIDPNGSNPEEAALRERMRQKKQDAEKGRTEDVKGDKHDSQSIPGQEYFGINGTVGFDQNAATVTGSGREVAAEVARKLKGMQWIVEVRGHVSALEASPGVETAMKLSFQRATAVAAVLAENGLAWKQIRVVGCADNERVRPSAYDAAAHRTNQRAEIVVTNVPAPIDPHVRESVGGEK